MHLFIGQIWCGKCEKFNLYRQKVFLAEDNRE